MSPATLFGLLLAFSGPLLAYALGQWIYGAEQSPGRVASGLVIHWINFAAVIAVVLYAEKRPLSSIGFRPMRWWTFPLGVAAGVVFTLLTGLIVSAFKLGADAQLAVYLQSLPFITRVLLVVTAGVFEETLYRGYGIERLTSIFGNKWAAGVVTVALFTLAHAPAVGWSHLLPVCIVSIMVTLLYLWKRDLVVNMVAHSTVDAIALLVAPAIH